RRLHVGEIEDAFLGGKLGVEDDLEQEVTELLRERRGGAALEGVVDLVGLLEQVLPEGGMRLLAVPRTAIRLAQAVADERHPPRPRDRRLGWDRRQVERTREVGRFERPDGGRPAIASEPRDGRVGRIEPPEQRQWIS